MRRRKGNFWVKKGSNPANQSASSSTVSQQAGASAPALDTFDYGRWYDALNARGKCDDLVLLEDVSNEGIVQTLRNRYVSGDMYTSIGPVLIAVNPYTRLAKGGRGIYEPGVRDYFHRKGGGDFMAPHIYRIAAEAYKNMHADSRDQCVIVTGESGAGKTEAAKQLMHFVTTVGTSSDEQRVTMEGVQMHLLESNPILEAFGNAQTIRNDNSSRFGKYMELQFTFKGMLRGGKVTNYLLEKSRVTGQADGERCFHVMHYLLEGATAREKSDFGLMHAREYAYLMKKDRTIDGVDDGIELIKLKASMLGIKIDLQDQSRLFHLLAGVLTLGNVCFDDQGDGKRATVSPTPDHALLRAAACLGVDTVALEAALTSMTLVVGGGGGGVVKRDTASWIEGESSYQLGSTNHTKHLNGGDSEKSRDALAKELYRRLFGWIVDKVNLSIEFKEPGLTMGILDIYGFEIFESNDFEQFCINYVNEKLQQYFIDHTIRAEQQDYETEGVDWEHVEYFNNKTVCDMIEGRCGLLSLLDETSSYKNNDGAVLVNHYNRAMGSHEHYFSGEEAVYGRASTKRNNFSCAVAASKTSASSRAAFGRQDKEFLDAKRMFGVRHFAGDVTYGAWNFIEKNADRLHRDLVGLLSESSNPLAAKLFQEEAEAPEDPRKTRRHPSISAQFKKQVDALCGSLARCRPHYVRCIKPNNSKTPLEMDMTMTTHQVKYLGLVENVRVRRQGYAFRMPFGHFVRRYGFLSESTWPDRTTTKYWPDGTLYNLANPRPPEHLIKYDEVEEEFQEMKEAEPDEVDSEKINADSSDDGVTDKEGATPPLQSTPPRPEKTLVSASARSTPARILQNFTPARLRTRGANSKVVRTPGRAGQTKELVMVTSKRVVRVERPVPLVDRTTWDRRDLSERQATFALLEEGRPKRWDAGLTGGKTVHIKMPRLCADSGDIKLGKTKIFIKHPHMMFDLEDQRAPVLFAVATIIQSKARGFISRRRYLRFLAVIGRVAAVTRGYLARARYRRVLDAVVVVQAVFRGSLQRARYARLRVAAKGRPLRYYALRIQRNYRGYKGRSKVPRRIIKRTRVLGPRFLVISHYLRGAKAFQAAWRMHVARKAFLYRIWQTEIVQACWRRHVGRQQFEKLREEDCQRTLSELRGGMTLVKHTVGSTFMMKKQRPVEFRYNPNGVLSWRGSGIRRYQGVNVISDVEKVTKGMTSRRLKRTGDRLKGEEYLLDLDNRTTATAGGKYLVLHQKSGKTLDLECIDYIQRDSIKRTLSKVRGEW